MDSALIGALSQAAPVEVVLVEIELPTHTIRWTDGGFVVWDGQTFAARDETYGVLSSIEAIEDGVDNQATVCALTILPPDGAGFTALIAPGVQGSPVTIHQGAVSAATGTLIGEPDLLARLELDQPRIGGNSDSLIYDCITEEARMLEANEERRLTDTFHQSAWPGELGYKNVTALPRKRYWRASNPNNAIR